MIRYINNAPAFIATHKKESVITIAVVLCVLFSFALFAYSMATKYVYQPVKACDLLTPAKAHDLLGKKVMSIDTTKDPMVSGNTAISKCSYTDTNEKTNEMIVAAIAVRSGINDKGVSQNKADFATAKLNNAVEEVKDVGNSAYFNQTAGQLNVLSGREWLILNYGVGSSPETNTVEKSIELARKVLN